MLEWCGRLVFFVSAITLLGLIILLIGFDQFVAMTLNPFLTDLITGFGYVVLGAAQDLGFKTLIWVLISAFMLAVFGVLLMLAGRFSKPKPAQEIVEEPEAVETSEWQNLSEVEQPSEKAVTPETLEEIEEAEKEQKDKKRRGRRLIVSLHPGLFFHL